MWYTGLPILGTLVAMDNGNAPWCERGIRPRSTPFFNSNRKESLREKSAEKVDRTPDLMIFSHTLSQLSYLGFWKRPELMPFLGTGREKTVNVCRIVDSFTQWVWKHKLIALASFGASLYRHDTIARFP